MFTNRNIFKGFLLTRNIFLISFYGLQNNNVLVQFIIRAQSLHIIVKVFPIHFENALLLSLNQYSFESVNVNCKIIYLTIIAEYPESVHIHRRDVITYTRRIISLVMFLK